MLEGLLKRDLEHIWHPFTQAKTAPLPIVIDSGEGSYLYTDAQKKLFDGISSWWTNSHGHCHPHIVEAIRKQAQKLEHVIFANFTHEPAIKLAEGLIDIAPKGLKRVFYSDNGSTAVEVAIKMAYQYWQNKGKPKTHFLALNHGYHGDTFGAMATSQRSTFTKPFWPLLFNVKFVDAPCKSRTIDGFCEDELTKQSLDKLRQALRDHHGQVAALIMEPMLQGAGGMRIFTRGFMRGLSELCREHDVLLIADEVATGFFRTGQFFACEHEDIRPDIMCLAKGLTGGFLPLSATLATEEIYRAFLSDSKADALLHGHSFTANPLGCAAALASLELFHRDETRKNVDNICRAIERGRERFDSLPGIKHLRNIGTIFIADLLDDHGGYLSNRADEIFTYCFERGLYIRPLGNVIYLMPPLCSTEREIDWALGLIAEAILGSLGGPA